MNLSPPKPKIRLVNGYTRLLVLVSDFAILETKKNLPFADNGSLLNPDFLNNGIESGIDGDFSNRFRVVLETI